MIRRKFLNGSIELLYLHAKIPMSEFYSGKYSRLVTDIENKFVYCAFTWLLYCILGGGISGAIVDIENITLDDLVQKYFAEHVGVNVYVNAIVHVFFLVPFFMKTFCIVVRCMHLQPYQFHKWKKCIEVGLYLTIFCSILKC